MRVLDSCYLIDLLNNKKDAFKKLDDFDNDPALFITPTNIFELALGIYLNKNVDKSRKIEELLKFLAAFEVLEHDINSSVKGAEIHGKLILEGKEIDLLDSLIAGTALANKAETIVTRNKKHFERVEGLKVESY